MSTDIRDKIAKLLALADSPNENEARVALLKARELMAEHKLRPDEIKKAASITVKRQTVGITCTKMTNPWAAQLSAIIAEHYCCKAFRSRFKHRREVTIGFVGLEEDFDVCLQIFRYAYDCVLSECASIRAKHKAIYTATQTREFANAYGFGFCKGLDEAFKGQQEQHEREWGLVLVVPRAVTDAMSDMGAASSFGVAHLGGPLDRFAADGYQDGQHFDPSTKLAQPQRGITDAYASR